METLYSQTNQPQPSDRSHAAIIHISALSSYIGVPFGSILGPLFTWMIWRIDSSFVDENGKEALNFNLSIFLYEILGVIIGAAILIVPILGTISTANPIPVLLSIPGIWIWAGILGLLGIFRVIFVIIGAIKASNGEIYRYPLSFRFIK